MLAEKQKALPSPQGGWGERLQHFAIYGPWHRVVFPPAPPRYHVTEGVCVWREGVVETVVKTQGVAITNQRVLRRRRRWCHRCDSRSTTPLYSFFAPCVIHNWVLSTICTNHPCAHPYRRRCTTTDGAGTKALIGITIESGLSRGSQEGIMDRGGTMAGGTTATVRASF